MPSSGGPLGLRPREVVPRSLSDTRAQLSAQFVGARDELAMLTGVTHDSRSVRRGDLYAALPGARHHGAEFVREAVSAGAVAVLTDPVGAAVCAAAGVPVLVVEVPRSRLGALAAWLYGEPARAMATVAITGTNGKTTTAYFVESVLRAAGRTTGLLGTIETRVGEERLPSVRTTPEATDLQALLAVMRERGVQAVAMEASSHALALGRVDGIVFDVAVFTNLSQDHLDFHADLEDYFRAKASLFTPARARRGVVDIDDGYGARLAATADIPITTVSPSGSADADWRVVDREVGRSRATTGFVLEGPAGGHVRAGAPLAGEFNVANAALAAVACLELGIAPVHIGRGLAGVTGVPGRMERVQSTGADEPLALVDYAHTPVAVDTLLRSLRAGHAGRLVVVLGAGGDRDPGKRVAMGEAAARHADIVVVTDDNPRSEDPAAIRAAVLDGARRAAVASGATVAEVPGRGAAIRVAVAGLSVGDIVVVAGKGHEQGQEVAGTVHPFDDRAELRSALEQLADARDPEAVSGRAPGTGKRAGAAPNDGPASAGQASVGQVSVGQASVDAADTGGTARTRAAGSAAPDTALASVGLPSVGAPSVGARHVDAPDIGTPHPDIGAPDIGARDTLPPGSGPPPPQGVRR